MARTDLDLDRHRRWWQVVRVLQWILLAAVVAGLLWLAAAFVLAYLQLPPLPDGDLGTAARADRAGARRCPGRAAAGRSEPDRGGGRSMHVGSEPPERPCVRSVAAVTKELVVQPVRAELDRYGRARARPDRATAR